MPRSTAKKSDAPDANAPPVASRELSEDATWDEIFREWRRSGDAGLREKLILQHHRLVAHLARRFAERGEPLEDLVQHGMIGLIQALDHFDIERGVQFSTFATPRIIGEIRRFFRDRSRGVRVPRRIQELSRDITHQVETLTQKFNRSPTYAEIALHLSVSEEEVIEAVELGRALNPLSLEDTPTYGESPLTLAERVGRLDPEIVGFEDREALREALEQLAPEQRDVLRAAYFGGHSQTEIARQMHVSQMHISRLLRRSLTELRRIMDE